MNDDIYKSDLSEIKSDLKYEKQELHNIVTKMNMQFDILSKQIENLQNDNCGLKEKILKKDEELNYQFDILKNCIEKMQNDNINLQEKILEKDEKLNYQFDILKGCIEKIQNDNINLQEKMLKKDEEISKKIDDVNELEARNYQYMLNQNQAVSRKINRIENYCETEKDSLVVSVIVAVFNTEQYLVQCLESIKNQTLKNIEIICIDDASTDKSRDIIETYCKNDIRFQLIINDKNCGAGISRNKGLKKAKGKYIICLDADDFFEPDLLEKMTEYAENKSADAVICKSDLYYTDSGEYEDNDSSIDAKVFDGKDVFTFLDMPMHILDFCVGWAWDKLVRRNLISDYDISFQEDVRRNEDVVYTCGIMMSASAISVIDYVGVHHRKSTNTSLEDTYSEAPDSFYKAGMELQKRLFHQGKFEFLERSYVNRCLGKSIYYLNELKKMNTEKYNMIKDMLTKQYFYDMKILNHKDDEDYFYKKKAYSVFLEIINEENQ